MKFRQTQDRRSRFDRRVRGDWYLAMGLVLLAGVLAPALGAASDRNRPFREVSYGEYVLRVYEGVEPGSNEKLEVLRNSEILFTAEDHRIKLLRVNVGPDGPYDPIGIGEDITGDGRPNVVVEFYSGGAHCCDTYLIFEIGERFRLVNRLDTGDYGITFQDLDDIPGFEIETLDDTFAYWKAPFAGSPAPRVVLSYRDGRYRPAPDLMRRPPMAAPVLGARARRIREGGRWGRYAMYPLDSRLWAVMLDLIYSGNAEQARMFLDAAWPAGRSGKEKFADELFLCKLRQSPYWPIVAEMNDVPAAEPEAVGECRGKG